MTIKQIFMVVCVFIFPFAILSANNSELVPLPSSGFIMNKESLDLNRPARSRNKLYTGPIIDTHVHFLKGLQATSVQNIHKEMKSAGVRKLIVMPTPNEGKYEDKSQNAYYRREWVEQFDENAGRLCGSTYLTRWMYDAFRYGYSKSSLEKRLEKLRLDLDSQGCLGIGEIGPYHFEKKPGMSLIKFPLNFKPMLSLVKLAEQKNVPLDMHIEPISPDGKSYEDEIFASIALYYEKYPKLRLILSHTGMTNAKNARALLQKYPLLMMNVKIVVPGRKLAWNNLGPIVNKEAKLFKDWAQLFEDMPDRFMIGTDARFGTLNYNMGKYKKVIKQIRSMLGSLEPDGAKKIAFLNAQEYFSKNND